MISAGILILLLCQTALVQQFMQGILIRRR